MTRSFIRTAHFARKGVYYLDVSPARSSGVNEERRNNRIYLRIAKLVKS
jgi:hypothetical protein